MWPWAWGWYIATAGSSVVKVYVKDVPGSMRSWVSGATPSLALSTLMPCQWMSVAMGRSFWTRTSHLVADVEVQHRARGPCR